MSEKSKNFSPKRALISVSDKRNLLDLAKALIQAKVEILATGGTASLLKEHQLAVTEVSNYTGFPEILDGRVKTLHPAIHAGLLSRGRQDAGTLKTHQLQAIDLLIVNLYPFSQVIANPNCHFEEAIENIDIGGPAMIRAAAKNHAHRYVIVNPDDYGQLQDYLSKKKAPANWGFTLAKRAFAHTAAYDAAIANYLGTLGEDLTPHDFPDTLTMQFHKSSDLRYGENPHQHAVFYSEKNPGPGSLAGAQVLQGKQLSYNNLLDADAALNCVKSFSQNQAVCAIIKHNNPCGMALGKSPLEAYQKAFAADPQSAFGGIIAFNQTLDAGTVDAILNNQFVEVILAPMINKEALALLAQKDKVRVLETGLWAEENPCRMALRQIDGGLLVQEHDNQAFNADELRIVSNRAPTAQELKDLGFAWQVAKQVKSNAMVLAKDLATIGIGAGQTSRVMSTRIALWQARQYNFNPQGSVLASDAFIPFPDSLQLAAEAGISAVIQPGGSVKDQEIIDLANRYNIAMVFTGIRHFRH